MFSLSFRGAVIFCLAVIIISFGYQTFSLHAKRMAVNTALRTLVESYATAVTEPLGDLADSQTSNQDLKDARDLLQTMKATPEFETLRSFQHTLHTFLNSIDPDDPLYANTKFQILRKEMSRSGKPYTALSAYNQAVQIYNVDLDTFLGGFIGHLLGYEKSLLLQTDGTTEEKTKVTL